MSNGLLLWVDDKIELLKVHIIFLGKERYEVVTVSSGIDAIDQCQTQTFDLVLLDEQVPGLSGLETLQRIEEIQPATPIVMVVKSEEENIMNQAIGAKIADYLIRPVNPNQILLTPKKNIHQKEIVMEVTRSGYQQDYQQIAMQIVDCRTFNDWKEVYRKPVHWKLELSSTDGSMTEILKIQKEEANNGFAKYVTKDYLDWVAPQDNKVSNSFSKLAGQKKQQTNNADNRLLLSTDIFKSKVFPLIDRGEKVFLIVIDNFRLDQWRILSKEIGDMFDIEEDLYMGTLPTATRYACSVIFSGLMPKQITIMFPELWVDENEEEGESLNKESLIQTQIDHYRRHDKFSYHKINNSTGADKFIQQYKNLARNDLSVLVANFVNMLSHTRTEMRIIRELANNESAYRSITLSWLQRNVLADIFRGLVQSDYKVIITTDYDSIRMTDPVKIIGDRNTNTNLRYKLGKSPNYDARRVFAVKNPHLAQLSTPDLDTSYVFVTGDSFFACPNSYNYYVSYYKDTFQHEGISVEGMIVPLATLSLRKR